MPPLAATTPRLSTAPAAVGPLLLLSFLATFGTAVLWNGLAFVARDGYGFDETWNLILAISNGGIYAIAAFASAPILRRLSSRIAPRTVIALVFLLQVLICPAILISNSPIVLFVVAGGMSFLAAFFWPVIEAFVSAGREPGAMRNAIGWWNTVWMLALGLALVSMAPLLAAGHAVWAIASLGPINLACVIVLYLGVPARIAAHGERHPDHAAPVAYVDLLASNRALLPLAYALIGALSPLMPYLLEDLAAPLAWQTPLVATWMFARVAGIAILRRWSWWHGRWAATLLGGVLLVGGFVAVVAAPSIPLIVSALIVFGLGQAVVYYAAMYYVMRVGDADVKAASTHEGLIGVGYGIGPAAALVGVAIGGGGAIIAASLALPALTAWPAIRPYLRSRRRSV
jgi:MFS family permease